LSTDTPSILIVDDENVVAMDLVLTLEKLHYSVAGVAASGEEAINLAESKQPSLVLMDIQLRGNMDGIRAAQQIQGTLFIPVVYLTAHSDAATLERARVTHPFGYVIKPFEDRELEVAIQTALYRHKMEQALRDNERRLEAILTSIGDAVIATDAGKRITFLNRAAETLLGWKSDRARGRLLSDVLKLASNQQGFLRLSRGGGETVPVELVESPVVDPLGGPTGYVTVVRDMTESLRAQQSHDREIVERAARTAAEKEHERARLKSEISLILSDVTQAAEPTSTLMRAAELIARNLATWCVVHLDDNQGGQRVTAHADPAKVAWAEQLMKRWPPDPSGAHGSCAVIRTGQPEWMAEIPDELLVRAAHGPEHLALLRKMGMTSYVCVPLRVQQRVIGALTFISTEPEHRYGEADVTFAQQVADRFALAVDNARLFREAQDARAKAEQLYRGEQNARAEAETLFRIAEAISEAQLDLEAVVQRLTDEATTVVGAKFGAFFYNVINEAGEAYMLYTLSGAPRESFERFGLPRNTPIFEPTFSGKGVVRLDDVRKDPRYGKMGPHHGMPKGHLPVTSYLAVPVVSRAGGVIGGLFFGHPEPGQFTEQHERVTKALAAHAAVAIDNARLFRATRAAEEKQSRLVRDLERTVRFSEMFVGILGHDLRNPLSAITTAASLVLSRAESERVAKPVSRILNSADRMGRMINQILDFTHARIGRGIPLRRRRTDLSDLCRLVIDELKGEAEEATDVGLDLCGDPTGEWDGDRLSQLFSNLVGNAVQHRPRGTAVSVTIDGTNADRVRVEIQNEGVIPPEIAPVIFEPFRGATDKKREGSSGLGLGLYISRQIVIAHGGSIYVETDAARGTRFTVDLPRTPPIQTEQVFSKGDAS
jgi:PAS domain S-box-containing protein